MYERRTEGHTDSQCDTKKPRHCRVARYKNVKMAINSHIYYKCVLEEETLEEI